MEVHMLGIMLINTGTAKEPTEEAIRDYLRTFLSDRHLVDLPAFIWKPILHLFILPTRPRKTLHRYQEFWTEEGSPFTLACHEQCRLIDERLQEMLDEEIMVRIAMRYAEPFIGDVLLELSDAGCSRIIVLPLYPQWTIACAGTILDEFDKEYAARFSGPQDGTGDGPAIIKIREYWDEPGYIQALASSVRRVWTWQPGSKLIVSYHSIPLSYVEKHGDSYLCAAQATCDALARELNIPSEDLLMAFQSRFDSRRWASPFLVPTVERLASEGVTDIAVVSPIFSVECIETHFETNFEVEEAFRAAAAKAGRDPNALHFSYVEALGADTAFMDVIATLIARMAQEGPSGRA